MEKFRRVAQLWNWLPGFRGVAEHENLHRAAQTLGISPSALSRTVKLLEEALGAPVFVRQGTGLQLTPLGGELLSVTRDSMRQVDDCIARLEARRGGLGPLHIGVTSDVGAVIVARAFDGQAGEASPMHVRHVPEDAAVQELLQGNLDLVVLEPAIHHGDLVTERIGDAQLGVYATHDHPVIGDGPATAEQLETSAYVALRSGPLSSPRSGKIACYCDSIEIARTVCESSQLLCVLPDLLVTPAGSLRRVAAEGSPVVLHAMRRNPLPTTGDDTRLPDLIGRLRATLGETARV